MLVGRKASVRLESTLVMALVALIRGSATVLSWLVLLPILVIVLHIVVLHLRNL